MGPIRRKISDLTVGDTNALLVKLEAFRSSLDEGDEELPAGLIDKMQELRDKLEDVKHTSFSTVDSTTLVSMKISSGPLFLMDAKKQEIERMGQNEFDSCLSMQTTQFLIRLVRSHVSTVTEAGRRILINMVLLRVASVMSVGQIAVNIIPEFAIPETTSTQDSGNHSFSDVVDFLVTKLSSRYTGKSTFYLTWLSRSKFKSPSEYLLGDPTTAVTNPQFIEGPLMSSIFEAKRDNVRAALPQAVLTTASYCKQQGVPVMRGCITSGEQWVFFVYERMSDGRGLVRSSPEFALDSELEGLALIVGLLQDWVNNATRLSLLSPPLILHVSLPIIRSPSSRPTSPTPPLIHCASSTGKTQTTVPKRQAEDPQDPRKPRQRSVLAVFRLECLTTDTWESSGPA
ncbi:hypothetical protein EW146_g4526 [Bondarzewia mesenterica]|uniref:Uncharacterized protein n=1 Tax=Bondarzewia mesenterica TaxID=1095465 RepID=A0A4S4LUU8_9AGAM|nr:hypothetical protein EW146_g4526 [Bondarzewia mesenterica]